MKKLYIPFFFLLSICCISPTLGQSIAPVPYYPMTTWDTSPYKSFRFTSPRASSEWINFRLLFPNGYDSTAINDQKYPIIIMLHGAGESARMEWNNSTKTNTPYPEGDPRIDNNDHQLLHGGRQHLAAVQNNRFPGFVLFPQNFYATWVNSKGEASSSVYKDMLKTWELIEYLITQLKIDPDRIYVHGLSNGGNGSWYAAYKRPDLFAAALPMSAPGDPAMAEAIKTVPLWVFQGELDTNPRPANTLLTVDAVRNAGGTVRYTEYAGTGHNTWNKAYSEPDFFEWMLKQRKGGGENPNQPPTVNAGNDKVITLPEKTASFTATATDTDGSVASYLWEKVSGPAASMSGTTTATLSLSGLVEGSYTFKVTVKDNAGATASDQVNLTVNPATDATCQSLAMDGTNKLSLSSSLVLSGDFTIEYWAKLSSGITNADAPLSGGSGQHINYYAAKARLYSSGATGGNDPIVSSHVTQADVWTHYAFVRQGSSMKVYINGVEDTGAKATGQWTGNFTITNLGQGAGNLKGELDEVRLWSVARSGTDINAAYNKLVPATSSGLLAYYTFEEQSGVVTDKTGNGYDSQAIPAGISRVSSGAPLECEEDPDTNQLPTVNAGTDKAITLPTNSTSFTASASDPDGTISSYLWEKISGPAASMSGTTTATLSLSGLVEGSYTFKVTVKDNAGATASDEVNLTVHAEPSATCQSLAMDGTNKLSLSSSLVLSGDFTIEYWAKLSSGITYSDAPLSGGSSQFINYYAGKARIFSSGATGGNDPIVSSHVTQADVWTHYAFVRQGSSMKVYINGVEDTGAKATGQWTGNFTITNLGQGYKGYLAGELDEVRLWSVARSGAAIAENYTSSIPASSGGLLAYYTFEEQSGVVTDKAGNGYDSQAIPAGITRVSSGAPLTDCGENNASAQETISEASISNDAFSHSSSTETSVSAYPNTFSNYLNIEIAAADSRLFIIRMIDVSGKTLYTGKLQAGPANAVRHRIEMDQVPLQQGMYFVLVEDQNGSFKKVLKVFRSR